MHGKLVGLEGLQAEAPGLAIEARSDLVGGVPAIVHLQRGDIGRSSATGTCRCRSGRASRTACRCRVRGWTWKAG